MTWWELLWGADSTFAACTSVPPAGDGVCDVCHAATRQGKRRCFACFRTSAQVTMPTERVVPISLYRTGDNLWHALRRYKDGRDAALRRRLGRRLGRLLSGFLRRHLACIAPGLAPDWRITVVPPTRRRSQRHPLEKVVRRSRWLRRRYTRTLRTAARPGHNAASDTAFRVVRNVGGLELVVVDDTFTTGASVQSAVSALRLAGARVVAVVVIGRVVNPDANPEEADLWEAARKTPWRLNRCCREGG
jgi:predicted amidophosphoribosyltransferase